MVRLHLILKHKLILAEIIIFYRACSIYECYEMKICKKSLLKDMIHKFTADKTNGKSCHYKTLDLAPHQKGPFSCHGLANLSEVHLSKFS